MAAVAEADDPTEAWRDRSLRDVCECQLCERLGDKSPHRGESHDQSLDQRFGFAARVSSSPSAREEVELHLRGGTTKCARVMMRYFERHPPVAGQRVLEVGSGTGLVGLCLLHLGLRVTFTDQEPMLDTVRLNVRANAAGPPLAERYAVQTLQWGQGDPVEGVDAVVGSDLIFANENIDPLVRTFEAHARPVYLASIRRFDWEDRFFALMKRRFGQTVLHEEGEITIYRFDPLQGGEEP